MKFDSIVIGGGMAGLSQPLRAWPRPARRLLLMASGQSALHFSSGSVDLLESDGDPAPPCPPFMAAHPDHPCQQGGMQGISKSGRPAAAPLRQKKGCP